MLTTLTLVSLLANPQAEASDPGALTILAEIALERGDCRTAAENYAAAAPYGSAELAKRASEVGLACEHLPAAWSSVQRWRTLAPKDVDAAAVYAAIALKLYKIADAQAAVRDIVASADSDPKVAELVSLLLEQAEAPAVLAAISGAVDTESASAALLTLVAEVALEAGDLHKAEHYAGLALKRNSEMFEARSLMAQIYAQRGDRDKAIAAARTAAQADSKRGTFEVFEILTALDRFDAARQELERLRTAGSSADEIENRLALLAYQSGDLEDAKRRFAAIATKGEAGEAAVFYLSEIAAREGDAEAALAGYRRLLSSSVGVAARTRAAGLLLARGSRAEGLTLLDDYVKEHPESSFEMTLAKVQLLSEHGETDSGLALLLAALERYPQHPALEYNRAVLLERDGQVRASAALLERLLKERPQDPTLLNALGYMLADHGMRLPAAEKLIREALAVTPDNAAVIDSLGWVRFKRGDARGATSILERAYTLSRDSEIAAHWGEALWKTGDEKKARKVWAAALERDPDSKALQAVIGRFVPVPKP